MAKKDKDDKGHKTKAFKKAKDKKEDIKKIQVSESINMMCGDPTVKTVSIDPNYVVSNA